MRAPSEPIWRGDNEDWKRDIKALSDADFPPGFESSRHGRAIAIAVFYRAACWNTLYRAPLDLQIWAWARVLDLDWLTLDLAERAVDQHFESDLIGLMLPFHVLRNATFIRLEEGMI